MRTTAIRLGWDHGRLRLWRRNEHGTWGYRVTPWWRRLPSRVTGALVTRHLLSGRAYRLHEAAIRWRGPLRSRYLVG